MFTGISIGIVGLLTKRDRSNGCEYYRMNPLNPNLQQNICFSVGNLRKIENGLPEPLSEVRYANSFHRFTKRRK
jgi:hypothetical protein